MSGLIVGRRGSTMGKGWKRRYVVAMVVLTTAVAAAALLPNSRLTSCLTYLGPGHDCLNHHLSLRLIILLGGIAIAAAIALLPVRGEPQDRSFSNRGTSPRL